LFRDPFDLDSSNQSGIHGAVPINENEDTFDLAPTLPRTEGFLRDFVEEDVSNLGRLFPEGRGACEGDCACEDVSDLGRLFPEGRGACEGGDCAEEDVSDSGRLFPE